MSGEGKRLHEAARAEAVAGDYQWRRAEKAEAEVERLREALVRCGSHTNECAVIQGWGHDNRCDCGLEAALHPDEEPS